MESLLREPSARPSRGSTNGFRWAGVACAGIFLILAATLGFSRAGLHYDEALFLRGATQLLAMHGPPTFTHEPGSWIRIAGQFLPLMDLPYEGSVKTYVFLPIFSIVGFHLWLARALASTVAALGIWGIVVLLRVEIGAKEGAAAGLILAVSPALLDQCVYDNNVVALWMGLLGLLGLALKFYLRRECGTAAWLLGFFVGIAIWTRANFVWFLGAVGLASILVVSAARRRPWRHWALLGAGVTAGALPLLVYEGLTRGGTFDFLSTGQVREGRLAMLPHRTRLLLASLISDGDHRKIWNGPSLPTWQLIFVGSVVFGSIGWGVFRPVRPGRASTWQRVTSVTFVIYALVMLASKLNITEHHFITLLPLAAVAVVVAARELIARDRRFVPLVAAVAVVYLALALSWDIRAAREIRRTGGVASWSDAIETVASDLMGRFPGRTVTVLDWGLANNLFVLTRGRLKIEERFWGASLECDALGRPWPEVLAPGGIFLLTPSIKPYFAAAGAGFRDALDRSNVSYRKTDYQERLGRPFAEVYEVSPLVPGAPRSR
jgi:hypothetical protein